MTETQTLFNQFVQKWRPDAALDVDGAKTEAFISELNAIRAAEFHAARQGMAREIVGEVIAVVNRASGAAPDIVKPAVRAMGAWRTMTVEQIEKSVAAANEGMFQIAVQSFLCSLCGNVSSTPEEAATHACEGYAHFNQAPK